jgi:hypothetical protein
MLRWLPGPSTSLRAAPPAGPSISCRWLATTTIAYRPRQDNRRGRPSASPAAAPHQQWRSSLAQRQRRRRAGPRARGGGARFTDHDAIRAMQLWIYQLKQLKKRGRVRKLPRAGAHPRRYKRACAAPPKAAGTSPATRARLPRARQQSLREELATKLIEASVVHKIIVSLYA